MRNLITRPVTIDMPMGMAVTYQKDAVVETEVVYHGQGLHHYHTGRKIIGSLGSLGGHGKMITLHDGTRTIEPMTAEQAVAKIVAAAESAGVI